MARIQFDYNWYTDKQRVMRYVALPDWTWRDFHAVVQVSQIRMMGKTDPIHVLIDFSATNPPFPNGIAAHARTFGKKHQPILSGNAVVIGLPNAELTKLGVSQSRTMTTPDGVVRFVDDEDGARQILAEWDAL